MCAKVKSVNRIACSAASASAGLINWAASPSRNLYRCLPHSLCLLVRWLSHVCTYVSAVSDNGAATSAAISRLQCRHLVFQHFFSSFSLQLLLLLLLLLLLGEQFRQLATLPLRPKIFSAFPSLALFLLFFIYTVIWLLSFAFFFNEIRN